MKKSKKGIENNLSRLALGMNDHVKTTVSKNASGVVTKVVIKTTSTKPNLEACKSLLDRYESKNKKAVPIGDLLPKSKRAKR